MSIKTKFPTKPQLIPGYPSYTANPVTGLIQNIETGTFLQSFGKYYNKVNIVDSKGKRKTALVARLLALTHIPNPKHYPNVLHLNGQTKDDRLGNLRWGSARDVVVKTIRLKNKYTPAENA
jgi:hypothetical protein